MCEELARLGDDVGIGGVDAVDVGVDLADVGPERRGQGHRGEIGAPPPEGGDLLVIAQPLETRHHGDLAVVEGAPHTLGGDPGDAGLGVGAIGAHADLGPGEGSRLEAEGVQCHGQERDGLLLAGGEQHVQLAGIRGGR